MLCKKCRLLFVKTLSWHWLQRGRERERDRAAVAEWESKNRNPNLTTVLFITVVSAVVFMVTFEGQGDAGPWGHAAELVGWVTGRGSWRKDTNKDDWMFEVLHVETAFEMWCSWILTTLLFITHVSTVVVTVALPDAADASAVRAAVLVRQTAVLW